MTCKWPLTAAQVTVVNALFTHFVISLRLIGIESVRRKEIERGRAAERRREREDMGRDGGENESWQPLF